MAKLDGVNVVDMQNGEITKIAHYGVEYTKVDDVPKVGDIAVINEGHSVVGAEVGDYYEVLPDVSGTYIDTRLRGNIKYVASRGYATLYRKLAQPPKVSDERVSPPFAEMLTSKVEAVEKRVSALEGAKGIGDTPEFSVGDTVKALRDGEFDDVLFGEFGKITKLDCDYEDSGDPYIIRVDTDDDYDFFRPQDLELASQVTRIPTVDDIVVITGNSNKSRNKVGDIGKVVKSFSNDEHSVSVEVPGRTFIKYGSGNYTSFSDMRHATDAEKAEYEKAVAQAEKDAAIAETFTKAGRKPNEYRKGDIARIFKSEGSEIVGEVFMGGTLEGGDCFGVNGFDGITEGAFADEGDTAEIVCFAEDRKDIAKGGR